MNFKISLFLKGMLMGIAEIIPGVSGGTLAFITGIYQELINSIKSINIESIRVLTKFQFKKFWTNINGSCLLYTSPSPRDCKTSRMPSSA